MEVESDIVQGEGVSWCLIVCNDNTEVLYLLSFGIFLFYSFHKLFIISDLSLKGSSKYLDKILF